MYINMNIVLLHFFFKFSVCLRSYGQSILPFFSIFSECILHSMIIDINIMLLYFIIFLSVWDHTDNAFCIFQYVFRVYFTFYVYRYKYIVIIFWYFSVYLRSYRQCILHFTVFFQCILHSMYIDINIMLLYFYIFQSVWDHTDDVFSILCI